MSNKPQNQKGIILILALMIMSILLSTALGFGFFILSDLRQAQEIDNAVVAYYFADSGIERTLYLFRHGGKEKIGNFTDQEDALWAIDKDGDINNDVQPDWTIGESTDYEPTFFRQRLYNGQNAKLYFIGRSDGTNISKSIEIAWFKGLNSPKLQVVFTQLNPEINDEDVLVYYTDINKIEISDSDLETGGAPVCFNFKDKDIEDFSLDLPSDYVVELKVLGTGGDYVDNLSVKAYSGSDCSIDYPRGISNISIKSIGTHNGARQAIYANIPPRDPISGLFGFVLFSEEDITKGY